MAQRRLAGSPARPGWRQPQLAVSLAGVLAVVGHLVGVGPGVGQHLGDRVELVLDLESSACSWWRACTEQPARS